jgi:hypothetical protein
LVVQSVTQERERHWPQTWICNERNDIVARLYLGDIKQEVDTRGVTYHLYEPRADYRPSPVPRWHAKLTWKLLLSAGRNDLSPAILEVKAEYEQPALARFDMFVSLTAKGVRGREARVINEGASVACLRERNDCRHTEEVVLEIPRDSLRRAIRTGLLIDLIGYGRTERLAIGKEVLWALGEKAQLR